MGDMFSADDIRLEQEAMAKIFTDAPRSVQFSPDLERGKALFDQIFANGVSALDITNLQPAITENNENMPEHRKMCDLLTLLSVKKSALNDADLLNLTDYLSSVGVG